MSKVIKVSDAANLAIHSMVYLASQENGLLATKDIASTLKVSEAHLAKVMQRLAKAGLVRGSRGPKGGFALACKGSDVTLLQVYEAVEGPLEQNQCLLGERLCPEGSCILGGLLGHVDEEVRSYLSKTRLSDVIGAYKGE